MTFLVDLNTLCLNICLEYSLLPRIARQAVVPSVEPFPTMELSNCAWVAVTGLPYPPRSLDLTYDSSPQSGAPLGKFHLDVLAKIQCRHQRTLNACASTMFISVIIEVGNSSSASFLVKLSVDNLLVAQCLSYKVWDRDSVTRATDRIIREMVEDLWTIRACSWLARLPGYQVVFRGEPFLFLGIFQVLFERNLRKRPNGD